MKLVVVYIKDATLPVSHQTFTVERFDSNNGVLKLYHINRTRPFRCINVDELSHWYVREEVKLKTEIEEFLSENHGNLNAFYIKMSDGMNAGQAFFGCLSRPHKYMLRVAGKGESLWEETEMDSPKIAEIIQWLKDESENYPEDHPIWHAR